jgi:hypothetical protein
MVVDNTPITVTAMQLRGFFHQWESKRRSGDTLTVAETNALTVDQVADTNTANFLKIVTPPGEAPAAGPGDDLDGL